MLQIKKKCSESYFLPKTHGRISVPTFLLNFKLLLMRVSGISTTLFIKMLLELWKYFFLNMGKFLIYFAVINFRMRKILRKFHTKVEEILRWLRKILFCTWTINYEEILKKCEDSLPSVKSWKNCKCNVIEKIVWLMWKK